MVEDMQKILEALEDKKITADQAKKMISLYAIEEVEEFAKIDIGRQKRKGIPEIILAETKEITQIKKIAKKMLEKTDCVLISRIKKRDYSKIIMYARSLEVSVKIGKNSSTIMLVNKDTNIPDVNKQQNTGTVGILAAGTSDIGVAEEARLVCEAMGCRYITKYDVGVAGLQRVFPALKEMIKNNVDCIVVVAGMEGALATLVSSMVDVPIIGVPTSVGYGYGKGGIAALASMLQSCSLGLAVVNIDNGIAAGGIASTIANRATAHTRTITNQHTCTQE